MCIRPAFAIIDTKCRQLQNQTKHNPKKRKLNTFETASHEFSIKFYANFECVNVYILNEPTNLFKQITATVDLRVLLYKQQWEMLFGRNLNVFQFSATGLVIFFGLAARTTARRQQHQQAHKIICFSQATAKHTETCSSKHACCSLVFCLFVLLALRKHTFYTQWINTICFFGAFRTF